MDFASIRQLIGLSDKTYYLLDNLKTVSWPVLVLDILIVTALFYMVYHFLYQTRAQRILYGLFIILILITVGKLFNLVLLNWLLHYVTAILVVAIPVVFQPELRGALERLGRAQFIGDLTQSKEQNRSIVDTVVGVALELSKNKTGGLIVFQRKTGLREYIENGTYLDANISSDLLRSIFYPKSSLHDGAVIIVDDKIASARSILPVSATQVNSSLGTRHQAGLAITEVSDAVSLIISEETGIISLAVGGKLERRIAEDRLRNRLSRLLRSSKN